MPELTDEIMTKAFNEWMRRFTEEPDQYEREYTTIKKFLEESNEGKEPTYGQICSAYMRELALAVQ